METFEANDYFRELLEYYNMVKENMVHGEDMLYCKNIYINYFKKLFHKNKFNQTNFDNYFNELDDVQKYNFYNYILSYELINITPLDIRIKLANFFKNHDEIIKKLITEHKSYIKYYIDNKSFRFIFHAPEYYPMYLNEILYYNQDNEFKNKITEMLKN